MATIITAPELFSTRKTGFSIFLAGAIDMGAAVDWQAGVIEAFTDEPGLTIVNPRRAAFTPDTLDEQIRWELDALERVDKVFLWFPKDAKAPISFFEAGLYWHTGKLMVGAEMGFYRRRNLELSAERYNVELHADLRWMMLRVRGWMVRAAGYIPE